MKDKLLFLVLIRSLANHVLQKFFNKKANRSISSLLMKIYIAIKR